MTPLADTATDTSRLAMAQRVDVFKVEPPSFSQDFCHKRGVWLQPAFAEV